MSQTPDYQHIDTLAQLRAERKTSAAARATYLEQAGDVKVLNSFLRVLSFVLVLCLFVSFGTIYSVFSYYQHQPRIVVRVDANGKPDVQRDDVSAYSPKEEDMRYFLGQWAQNYYGRNRFSVRQDFPKAFLFMDAKLANNIIQTHQTAKDIEQFLANGSAPNTFIEISQITLDHLSQPPYNATIEFTAKQVAPYSDQIMSQSRYTATVQFVIKPEAVTAKTVMVNPLGFTILQFHDQQAFN